MKLSNKCYNILKWIALIAIPAIAVFLSVVLNAVGVDVQTVNVITTIMSAVSTLIGTLIGVSTSTYNKETK